MKATTPLRAALIIGLATLNSCRTPFYKEGGAFADAEKALEAEAPPPPPLYEWNGAGISGSPRVEIDLGEQKARVYKGKTLAGWSYVATGLSTHPTPTGSFKITERKIDKTSNKYGVIQDSSGTITDYDAAVGREKVPAGSTYVPAPMPYWMRLTSAGVGMHAGPIPNPGSPASHGCIRLPKDFAPILFFETKEGTPVLIKR